MSLSSVPADFTVMLVSPSPEFITKSGGFPEPILAGFPGH
jgi:hypothetical protein